jgi:P pilus assembly chaperone PapD
MQAVQALPRILEAETLGDHLLVTQPVQRVEHRSRRKLRLVYNFFFCLPDKLL